MRSPTRKVVLNYGGAALLTALAVALRLFLDPLLGDRFPFVMLFTALILIAWYGGRGPALLSLFAGMVAGDYFFLHPRYTFTIGQREDQIGLMLYGILGITCIALFESLSSARRRAEGKEHQLQEELARRRAAEQFLAEESERLRTTLASIGDAVITTDAEGRVTGMNAAAEALTGWSYAAAAGQPLDAVYRVGGDATRQTVSSPAAGLAGAGVVAGPTSHFTLLGRDGSERVVDGSVAPIRCEAGGIVGSVLVCRDVSHRQRSDEVSASRLRAARLLAAIVESSDDAIVSKSLDGIIQSWNAAAERLFGFPAEEAVGRHISLVIPPDRTAEEDQIIATLKAGKRIDHFETVRLRKDGRPVLVSLTISPVRDEEGRIVGASKIARDITGRRQAEERERNLLEAAATANAKFRAFFDQGPVFAGVLALDGTLLEANRLSLEACGYTREQVIGKRYWDCAWWNPSPDLVEKIKAGVATAATGEEFRAELPYYVADGSERVVDFILIPIKDESGRVLFLAPTGTDITERKRAEDALKVADRRKDEFLATLAHELRNPLAPIRNALQIIRLAPDRDAREKARSLVERQIGQMVRLVDDLLDVSRISMGKLELRRELVQLSAVIDSAVETSRPLIDRQGHQLTVTLPDEPVSVNADLTRLAQVFSNLLNNSAKYTDRGGHITLSARREGSDVVVSVKDTGIGIAAEHLPRLFEMFSQVESSLARSQGGLGIGLTLVKRLVGMHEGRIEARSAGPGKGAEFVVRLPVAPEEVGPQGAGDDEERAAPKSSLRILIVDDNRDAADSLVLLLQIMGHETRTAYDGQEGVIAAEEFRPDVVLLDIGLPKLNGYETCRRIRDQVWGKNAILIAVTGWGQEEDRRRSREAGFDHHMVKPLDPHDLMKLLAGFQMARS